MRHGDYDHQYKLYKNRYTNCTHVDENLEITNLEGSYDLSFLKDIEEVTGYVLIVNIFSNYLNLTNLRIIRGETLYNNNYSLYVALNHNPYNDSQGLLELQFVSLSGEFSFLGTINSSRSDGLFSNKKYYYFSYFSMKMCCRYS